MKNWIAKDRPEEAIRRLKEEVLADDSPLWDELILIEARQEENLRSNVRGVVSFENKNLTFNSVREALLWLINHIEVGDLRESLRRQLAEFIAIPAYHAHAVNRHGQVEQFEEVQFLSEDPDCKVHFFYLHGDLRQETKSLVYRLSLQLGGHGFSLDALRAGMISRDPLFVRCKPEPRGSKQLFQILLLKCLIEKFVGPVNNQRDLRQKTLRDLLGSPKLATLGPQDAVCVLVALDDYNWRADIVPEVLQELYETFCSSGELPAESPVFYFFFGVEYQRDNERVKQEVAAAIEARKYGEAFPELLPVPIKDIAEWFTRHDPLIPAGREAADRVAELFADREQLDMIDIEIRLQALIDEYNKGLLT